MNALQAHIAPHSRGKFAGWNLVLWRKRGRCWCCKKSFKRCWGTRTHDLYTVAPGIAARVDAHSAIEFLQMGFVPVNSGTRYVKPDEPDFDLDWLTSRTRTSDEPLECRALNITLHPLRFMELALEAPIPAALLGGTSAIDVNLPAPATYAVGKLLVAAERTGDSQSKTKKDIAQAAALIEHFRNRWNTGAISISDFSTRKPRSMSARLL